MVNLKLSCFENLLYQPNDDHCFVNALLQPVLEGDHG